MHTFEYALGFAMLLLAIVLLLKSDDIALRNYRKKAARGGFSEQFEEELSRVPGLARQEGFRYRRSLTVLDQFIVPEPWIMDGMFKSWLTHQAFREAQARNQEPERMKP